MPQTEATQTEITTSLRFPVGLYTDIKVEAVRSGRKVGDVLADAARQYLASLHPVGAAKPASLPADPA